MKTKLLPLLAVILTLSSLSSCSGYGPPYNSGYGGPRPRSTSLGGYRGGGSGGGFGGSFGGFNR